MTVTEPAPTSVHRPQPPAQRSFAEAFERAAAGFRLDADDAEVLLSAEGDDAARVRGLAAEMRDAGLREAGRPGVITYSRKVFVPLTTLCRDRCHYCIFVDTLGQLLTLHKPVYMTPEQVLAVEFDPAGKSAGNVKAIDALDKKYHGA